jgi:16S rRNA G966 N2-methylase RsmD
MTGTPLHFDLVLLDPPYDIDDLDAVVGIAGPLVAAGGRLVLEHARRRASPERADGVHRVRVLTAGDSALSFYVPDTPAAAEAGHDR